MKSPDFTQDKVEVDARVEGGSEVAPSIEPMEVGGKEGGDKKPRGFFDTKVDQAQAIAADMWNSLKKVPILGQALQLVEFAFKLAGAIVNFFASAIDAISDKINGKGKGGRDEKDGVMMDDQGQEMAPEDKRPFTKSVDKFFDKFFGKSKSEKDGVVVDIEYGPDFTVIIETEKDAKVGGAKEEDGVSPNAVFEFLTKLLGDEAIMKQLSEISGVGDILDEMSGAETGEEFLESLKILSAIPGVQDIISGAGEEFGISGEDVTKAIDSTMKDPAALEAVDKAFLEHKPASLDAPEAAIDGAEVVVEIDGAELDTDREAGDMSAALAEVGRDATIVGGLGKVELRDGEVGGPATEGVSDEIEGQQSEGR